MSSGPVDLERLRKSPGDVVLPGGRAVAVLQADGYVYRTLEALGAAVARFTESPELGPPPELANTRHLWDLVKRVIPDISEQELDALTPVECGLIIRLAQGRIQELLSAVEQAEGNGAGAAEAPSPPTPAGMSAPA